MAVAVAEKLALPETLGDLDKLGETLGLLEATTDPVFVAEKELDPEIFGVNEKFEDCEEELLFNALGLNERLATDVVEGPIGAIFKLYVVCAASQLPLRGPICSSILDTS